MKKPEHIYLSEGDDIESFAPEQAGEPRRAAHESSQEQLDAFQPEPFASRAEPFTSRPEPLASRPEVFPSRPEVFSSSPRASVHYQSRHRIHPAALAAVAGMTAVFAVVLAQRSNAPAAMPIGSVVSSTFGDRKR